MLTDLVQAFTKTEAIDPGLRTWLAAVRAWSLTWPPDARVLEIGCSVADWLEMAAYHCPTIQGVAIDWNGPRPGKPGKRLKGDVLSMEFGTARFDVIVLISTIEHIGLGHYGDPLAPDGDVEVFARCADWLAPGGWIYADVPYDPRGYRVLGTKCRIYDDAALRARFTHDALPLAHRAYMNLAGDLIDPPPPSWTPRDERRPYVYAASVWRKKGTPDASEAG